MNAENKNIFVTGGAHGIGRALCERFEAGGAKKIIVADVDYENARTVAERIGGEAVRVDVADETNVKAAIESVLSRLGHLDCV